MSTFLKLRRCFTWKTGIEAFLDRRLRPIKVFSSATKFLLEVPRMIFDWESLLTADAGATAGGSSGSSTESPRSFARALKVLKMAPFVLKYKRLWHSFFVQNMFCLLLRTDLKLKFQVSHLFEFSGVTKMFSRKLICQLWPSGGLKDPNREFG